MIEDETEIDNVGPRRPEELFEDAAGAKDEVDRLLEKIMGRAKEMKQMKQKKEQGTT